MIVSQHKNLDRFVMLILKILWHLLLTLFYLVIGFFGAWFISSIFLETFDVIGWQKWVLLIFMIMWALFFLVLIVTQWRWGFNQGESFVPIKAPLGITIILWIAGIILLVYGSYQVWLSTTLVPV